MHGQALVEIMFRVGDFLCGPRRLSELEILQATVDSEALGSLSPRALAIYLTGKEPGSIRLGRHRGEVSPEAGGIASHAATDGILLFDETSGVVALPIRVGEVRAGSLLLVPPIGWKPEEEDRTPLVFLGKMLALALLRARAHETEVQLREKISVVRDAALAVADALAILPEPHLRAAVVREFRLWPSVREEAPPEFLKEVLQTIVDHARRATDARLGALGFGDTPSQPFDPWVFSGVTAEQALRIGKRPRPVGTLGVVAREGEVIRTSDVREHKAFRGLPPNHPEVTSLLGVPIRYRGVNLGNLYLANKEHEAPFTVEDQQVVELLASQAAISLQQAYFRAAIDTQRAQLQIILDSSPHGLLFVEARSGEVVANPRAMQLLGRPLAPHAGREQYVEQLHRPDGRSLRLDELPSSRALAGETVLGEEYSILQPDGSRIPVLGGAAPVVSFGQEVIGAVITFEDVSSLKALERLREEFAAVVAHDLRDPIQGILLQVDLIRRNAQGDTVRAPLATLERIEANAYRLGQMTNDLLDATRIELGRVALDRKEVDVAGAIRGLAERIRPALGAHPFSVEATGAVGRASLDPLRFEQIVGNLLENAAKFSPETAPITVRVRPLDGGVDVAVEDRGIGIARDEMPRLFDRFYQSRRARERKSGLGLGLYITKGLVEAHGGRIRVETRDGQGATFHVWFPASAAAHR